MFFTRDAWLVRDLRALACGFDTGEFILFSWCCGYCRVISAFIMAMVAKKKAGIFDRSSACSGFDFASNKFLYRWICGINRIPIWFYSGE